MTAQPVRQKRVRPLKVHNETQEKWVSGFFWPPEWLRYNCRANESRRPEQKTGRQWLPGSSQPRREEGLVFAFASLCGVLRGPQACLGPRIVEHYSMVPRPASSANPQEYLTVRGLESSDSSGLDDNTIHCFRSLGTSGPRIQRASLVCPSNRIRFHL